MPSADFERLVEDFELLDDWEDRYRAVIDLGKTLPPMPDSEKTSETKVQGCASQVWLKLRLDPAGRLDLLADGDAHIVRGLAAVMRLLYQGAAPQEAIALDAAAELGRLGLAGHLSAQRSNGLKAMAARIRAQAQVWAGA